MSNENPTDETPAPRAGPPPPAGDDPLAPDADARDETLGSMLAVEELDDLTRRRLVRTALDDADAYDDATAERRVGRRAAVLGVAAALVIGAVVGTVIVTQPDDPTTSIAARAPITTAAGEEAKAAAPNPAGASSDAAAAEAPAAAGAPPVELGDLGAVSGAAGLRAAINRRLEAGTSSSRASIPCGNQNPSGGAGIYGLIAITAAGTATVDGRSVVIFVGPTRAGQSVAVVLDSEAACAFVRNVPL